jgi:hypothetical protein
MREWLIRKLGGVPAPEEGIALLVYEDQEGPIEARVDGGRFEMIDYLGGVPLPKAGEGQIVVGPCVKRLPVRKRKSPDNPLNIISEQDLINAGCPVYTGAPPAAPSEQRANLCDTCNTTVQECRQAVKEIDSRNNTIKCDRWRDL